MIGEFITFKSNKDGSTVLYFAPGLDKHQLIDMEGKPLELDEPKGGPSDKSEALRLVEQYAPIIRAIDGILSPYGVNVVMQDNSSQLFEGLEPVPPFGEELEGAKTE
jgi:hypothetical protein